MMLFRTLCVVFLFLAKGCHSQLNVCGQATLNTRIVGGQNAIEGSWPWQVSLQQQGRHFCGGSLINDRWILSAAHCFERTTAAQTVVKLGMHTLSGSNSNTVTKTISSIFSHPNYNNQTNENDICLLKLSTAVTFNDYISPACLAATGSSVFNGTMSWVTGWGVTSFQGSLPSSGILQEVKVSVIGNRKCNCLYGVGSITSNMLCAGALEGGKDSCQGDSGGPLVIKKDSKWIQVGIVSFGFECARPNFPGVYTKVSQYQGWIDQTITTNQPGFIQVTSSGTNGDLQVSCNGLSPAITITPALVTTVAPVVCGRATLNTPLGASSPLASLGAWPWIVSLHRNGTHVCGGTLIAEQFVMSSADCFSSSTNSSDWTVKLGQLNQNGSNPNEVSVTVANITFSNNSNNNIAVLKLSTAPTLSNFIQPICVDLGNTNFTTGTQCWAAGWGSGGGAQQTLQQFNTTIVNCGNASSSNSICTEAIPLEQTQTGGPLMCKIGTSWIQAATLTLTNNSSNSTTGSNNSTDSTTGSNNGTDSTTGSNNSTDSTTGSNNSTDSTTGSNNGTDSTTGSNNGTDSTTESNNSTDSTTGSNNSSDSTTGSNNSTDSTTGSNNSSDSTTGSNNSTDSITESNNSSDSTTGSNNSTDSTTGSNNSSDSTTGSNNSTDSTTESNNSSDSTTGSNNSSDSTTGSNNSSDSTTGFNTVSDETTNSTNSSKRARRSTESLSDVSSRNTIQVFTKTSSFKSFLESTVGSFPSQASNTDLPSTSSGYKPLQSLSVASVFLLSFLAIIQTFGLE